MLLQQAVLFEMDGLTKFTSLHRQLHCNQVTFLLVDVSFESALRNMDGGPLYYCCLGETFHCVFLCGQALLGPWLHENSGSLLCYGQWFIDTSSILTMQHSI